LSKGSIVEQKSFLRSFIERIIVNHPTAEVFYNIPILNGKSRTSKSEVLPILQIGSPAWNHIELFWLSARGACCLIYPCYRNEIR